MHRTTHSLTTHYGIYTVQYLVNQSIKSQTPLIFSSFYCPSAYITYTHAYLQTYLHTYIHAYLHANIRALHLYISLRHPAPEPPLLVERRIACTTLPPWLSASLFQSSVSWVSSLQTDIRHSIVTSDIRQSNRRAVSHISLEEDQERERDTHREKKESSSSSDLACGCNRHENKPLSVAP